jgi:YidC/Oxa1 family membrane protein insertase
LNRELVEQADAATVFGAPLSDTFMHANSTATRDLTIAMIVMMSATTFTSQRQLMMKNMPASALDNPFAQQQKILLYVLPLVFAVSGVNFPIGVLIYWLITNVWSMGQQFYVIRRMPAPGSPAEKALQERRARRGLVVSVSRSLLGFKSDNPDVAAEPEPEPEKGPGQRQQPKRKPKRKRSPNGPGGAPRGAARGGAGTGSKSEAGAASGADHTSGDGKGGRPSRGR